MLEGVPSGHHEKGLKGFDSVTSNGALNLIKPSSGSFRRVFASAVVTAGCTSWQRPRQIAQKRKPRRYLPMRAVCDAPRLEARTPKRGVGRERFGEVYPAAVRSFAEDLEALC
jgi:hypothetical protein